MNIKLSTAKLFLMTAVLLSVLIILIFTLITSGFTAFLANSFLWGFIYALPMLGNFVISLRSKKKEEVTFKTVLLSLVLSFITILTGTILLFTWTINVIIFLISFIEFFQYFKK